MRNVRESDFRTHQERVGMTVMTKRERGGTGREREKERGRERRREGERVFERE